MYCYNRLYELGKRLLCIQYLSVTFYLNEPRDRNHSWEFIRNRSVPVFRPFHPDERYPCQSLFLKMSSDRLVALRTAEEARLHTYLSLEFGDKLLKYQHAACRPENLSTSTTRIAYSTERVNRTCCRDRTLCYHIQ